MTFHLFWCGNLQTGNLVVGWLTLAIVVLNAVSAGIVYSQVEGEIDDDKIREDWTTYIDLDGKLVIYGSPYICIFGVFAMLKAAVAISQIFGTYKERRHFLIPYLVLFTITTALEVFVTLYRLIVGVNLALLFPGYIAVVPIGVYFLCVVGMYYVKLR